MREPTRRLSNRLAAITTLALIAACGSNSPTGPTPTPTPTPAPVVTLLSQGSETGLAAHFVHYQPFTTSNTGRIDATVDWTYVTDDVLVVVAAGNHTCFDGRFINFTVCNVIASAEGAGKPEKLSIPGQPAGVYTLYIDNRGPNTEAISWQVLVTIPG